MEELQTLVEAAVIEADLEHVEVILRGLERGQEREVGVKEEGTKIMLV